MRESSSTFEVLLTEGAEQDLESIYDYIAQFDCAASADYVLDQLASVIERLATCPQPGGHPCDQSEVLRDRGEHAEHDTDDRQRPSRVLHGGDDNVADTRVTSF